MIDIDFICVMQQGLLLIVFLVMLGLFVIEYCMDGLLLGNVDIEIYNYEVVYGICVQGDSDEYE